MSTLLPGKSFTYNSFIISISFNFLWSNFSMFQINDYHISEIQFSSFSNYSRIIKAFDEGYERTPSFDRVVRPE